MNYTTVLGTLALCSLLVACGKHSNVTIIGGQGGVANLSLGIDDKEVTLHPEGVPDAIITAHGDFRINQQPITLTSDQRELLKSYYDNAVMIPADGIAAGKAGAAVGVQALKSVATQLADGKSDQIQKDVEAKVQTVQEMAFKICQDLGNIKAAQDQLAVQLPAFKPYGKVIGADSVNDCEKNQKD